MKKQLLGTTTLVAAGLMMASGLGQQANASEPLSLSVGGYLTTWFQYIDQSENSGGLRDHDFIEAGEIQFTASGELDNGLMITARIEYEAANQGGGASIVDERYVSFSGGFGMLRVGSVDGPASAMHYQGPAGGTAWWIGVSSGSGAVLSGGGATAGSAGGLATNAASSFADIYPGFSGDGQKIIYYTPRISGFQLGLSYQPDNAVTEHPCGGGGFGCGGTADNTAGGQANVFDAGLNYQGSFDEIDISASGVMSTATREGFAVGTTDRDSYGFGLSFGYRDFAIGGSFMNDDDGAVNGDTTTYVFGATYAVGPFIWGLNYAHTEDETGAATKDELDIIGASFDYSLGAGVNLIGALKYYDYDTDTPAVTAAPDGVIFALGTVLYF